MSTEVPERREPRLPAEGRVFATCIGDVEVDSCDVLDLSAGGFSLRRHTAIEPGTSFYFELTAGDSFAVTCPATAKYCRPSTTGYVSGWRFEEDADPEAIEILRPRLLADIRRVV